MSDEVRYDPAEFPLDDRRVYDAYIASRMSAALAAAVRIGVFEHCALTALPVAVLAQRCGVALRPLRSLCAALVAMGLLERAGDADDAPLRASADAARYAVAGVPGSLAGLIDLEIDNFLTPQRVLDALRADSASVYGSADPWQEHAEDPAKARAFTAAMHAVSERPAAGFAARAPLAGVRRLLDVGGGSGALSIAVARRHRSIECVVWDIPVVCALADGYIAAGGVADRVRTAPGDMFGDPFPRGFDAVLFSQILHDWPLDVDANLLGKAFDALPSGGRVLVHEKLVDDDGRAPLANALVHLDMIVWTAGQQLRLSDVSALLAGAGFTRVERLRGAGYWSIVTAQRP